MQKSIMDKLNRVYNNLMDEESRKIFNVRLKYVVDKNQDEFEDGIGDLYIDWKCNELVECISKIDSKGIIIFGSGHDGKRQKKHLEKWGYKVDFFCDSDEKKVGKKVEDLNILSLDNVIDKYRDYLIIISSRKYGAEMYEELIGRKFPKDNILNPQYGMLIATHGKQYFDVFEASKNESYVDCGAYNGDNIFDFCDWTNSIYNEITAFEPIPEMTKVMKDRCSKNEIKNISVINGAVWDKKETIIFSDNGPGSAMRDDGSVYVNGIDIDSIMNGKCVTYIKMDIEGSELKALQGANNVITTNKPKLAVCIYHKDEDIYEIGNYLLELVPEYKFIIRHYNSNIWETVLYAYV